jgi:F-type H+-transporting ATPase subunit a
VPVYGFTATGCIYVTAALALTTFAVMIGGGMQAQGAVGFWKNLVPHGLPTWLVPLMLVVELIGLMVKPFALTIRLFANMLAGHLVIGSFLGLIFFFAPMLKGWTYVVAVPSVGLQVFIMIIEGFVALLQAYIFTYLSILFVGMCRHPEH